MKITLTIDDFGENKSFTYEVRRPNMAELSLFLKQTQAQDPLAAAKSLCSNILTGEEKTRFNKDCDEYPGLPMALSARLASASGLTAEVSRKN